MVTSHALYKVYDCAWFIHIKVELVLRMKRVEVEFLCFYVSVKEESPPEEVFECVVNQIEINDGVGRVCTTMGSNAWRSNHQMLEIGVIRTSWHSNVCKMHMTYERYNNPRLVGIQDIQEIICVVQSPMSLVFISTMLMHVQEVYSN